MLGVYISESVPVRPRVCGRVLFCAGVCHLMCRGCVHACGLNATCDELVLRSVKYPEITLSQGAALKIAPSEYLPHLQLTCYVTL